MIATKTIVRPANTTAYSIGDVINADGATTPIELNYSGNNLHLLLNQLVSSNASDTPAIDVYLYSQSFTIADDNSAFDPNDTQAATFLGLVSHTTWRALPSNKNSSAKPEAPIAVTNNSVYVVLVAAGAYTPMSAESITITSSIG